MCVVHLLIGIPLLFRGNKKVLLTIDTIAPGLGWKWLRWDKDSKLTPSNSFTRVATQSVDILLSTWQAAVY